MADDMYGANQQESNETANNGYYEQQEQPTQPAQPTQTTQPAQTYSPAPEFGAYYQQITKMKLVQTLHSIQLTITP